MPSKYSLPNEIIMGLSWHIAMVVGWGSEDRSFKSQPSRQPLTPGGHKIQKIILPVRKKCHHHINLLDASAKKIQLVKPSKLIGS